MNLQSPANPSFRLLFDSMGEPLQHSLVVMSAAVSLTDEVASQLLRDCCTNGQPPDALVRGIHGFDFVVERNSEWHFEAETREYLLGQLYENREVAARVHTVLLDLAKAWDGTGAGETMPEYLTWPLGQAYHLALGDPQGALRAYAESYAPRRTGDQWLLGQLTGEQQRMKLLPADAIEPSFFQGMAAYREGRWSQAEKYLSRLEDCNETRSEVGIGLHILGLLRDRGHREVGQIEALLRRSLWIGEEIGHRLHQAQVLHTLGNLIQRRDPKEAQALLCRSLRIGKEIDHRHHQAQVLHTFGRFIQRRDPKKAEALLRRSLQIGKEIDHRHHQAQVLHTLGSLTKRRDPKKAEALLQRSLRIGEEISHRHHQAQVLNTLGDLRRSKKDWSLARQLYREAIVRSDHPADQAVANLGLSYVAQQTGDLHAAVEFMESALEFQKRTKFPSLVLRHRRRLSRLRQLLKD